MVCRWAEISGAASHATTPRRSHGVGSWCHGGYEVGEGLCGAVFGDVRARARARARARGRGNGPESRGRQNG
eukprot:4628538-Prymnesium_polylepis.1